MIAVNRITVKVQYHSFIIRMRRGEVEGIEGVGGNFVVWWDSETGLERTERGLAKNVKTRTLKTSGMRHPAHHGHAHAFNSFSPARFFRPRPCRPS